MTSIALIAALWTLNADPGWEKLPPLPDAQGFAGMFAGVSGNTLLAAGGANFPDKKPWEGGVKRWYDAVYALDKPDGRWRVVGKLPRPLGYGISATINDAVVCVGGSDADRHYADVFRVQFESGKLLVSKLPPLPIPVANACGTLVGDTLYLAGGLERPGATATLKRFFALDLKAKASKWRELDPWPGPARMLSTAASFDGAFWLVGGTDLTMGKGGQVERRYLRDAYRFDPGRGWKRVADLPVPVVAAPSPAAVRESGFLVLGGDDGRQVTVAPDKHAGFSRRLLRFDAKTGRWIDDGGLPAAQVTAPLARWNNRWILVSGEVRPGVRSPDVWDLRIK